MRLQILVLLTGLTSIAGILLGAPAAHAAIPFSQQVVLRNDPGPFYRNYSSFPDGWGSCSNSGCGGWPWPTAHGKLQIVPRTYKLKDQNTRYDYYLVDLEVRTSNRSGSKYYGYLDANVQSAASVSYATYSLGKSEVSGCRTYPINIAASWGAISAGTTVGSFSLNCVNAYIHRKAIRRGQSYSMDNLNGVTLVDFERFVRVAAGSHPKFNLRLQYPTDKCAKAWVSDGSNLVLDRWCTNQSAVWSRTIGTTG